MIRPPTHVGFQVLIASSLVMAASALSSCKESKFNATTGTRQPAATPKTDDASPEPDEPIEQSFELSKTGGKLDIVWAIDTSGSMREEAAHVQQNFNRFASTLTSRSDVQFAVIARRSVGSGIGVDLGSSSSDKIQIDVGVGSRNALALIAAAVCPSNSTAMASGRLSSTGSICGQQVSGIESGDAATRVAGRLQTFLRPEAKPVFVVVTDDDASGVTNTNVLDMIRPHLNKQEPIFYAFRGRQSRSGCSVAAPGAAYESLASSTGGQVFDICEPDWSPNFALLSKAVTELASLNFTLKADGKKIKSVSIDGRTLRKDDYIVSGRNLEIKKGVVSPEAKTLTVHWFSE
jgi:hypothetical protein